MAPSIEIEKEGEPTTGNFLETINLRTLVEGDHRVVLREDKNGDLRLWVGRMTAEVIIRKFLPRVEKTRSIVGDELLAMTLDEACETIGCTPQKYGKVGGDIAVLTFKPWEATQFFIGGDVCLGLKDQKCLNETVRLLAPFARMVVSEYGWKDCHVEQIRQEMKKAAERLRAR